MRSYRFVIASLAVLGLFVAPLAIFTAQAAEMKTINVATDATWPPMEIVDANKNIVGFDIDFLNAVAKEAGFKVEFKNTAWDGIFAGLEAASTTRSSLRSPSRMSARRDGLLRALHQRRSDPRRAEDHQRREDAC